MINHDQRWSLPRGNTPVPSRWQATRGQAWLVDVRVKTFVREPADGLAFLHAEFGLTAPQGVPDETVSISWCAACVSSGLILLLRSAWSCRAAARSM